MHGVPPEEMLGDPLGQLPAQVGEVIVGQAPVEQPGGILHLSVSYEMHNCPVLTHSAPSSRYPEALAAVAASPIDFTVKTLRESLAAHRSGDGAAAMQLALTAYLEDFGHEEADILRQLKAIIAKLPPAA